MHDRVFVLIIKCIIKEFNHIIYVKMFNFRCIILLYIIIFIRKSLFPYETSCFKHRFYISMALNVDQYYLFISSNQCDNVYPLNNNVKFSIDLPSNLVLTGMWEVALIELNLKISDRQYLLILSDLCHESFVEGKFLPVLKRLSAKKGLNNGSCIPPIYMSISRDNIKTINFHIFDSMGNPASLVNKISFLTLHLRKRTYGIF